MNKSLLKTILITFASGFIGVISVMIDAKGFPFTVKSFLSVWLQSAALFVILWKGNERVNYWLDKVSSWLHEPVKRFVYGILGALVYTTVILLMVGAAINHFYDIPFSSDQMLPLYYANGIAVFMFTLIAAREFLFSWRKLALQMEQMKNELLTAKYETLKNQVNPHFLFNSLNSLSSLINEDPKLADQFVTQLSQVYRYVLASRSREVVALSEELEMLRSFVFLEQIRYGDNLKVEIKADDEMQRMLVLPLVLQMLVENAIKHNTITKEEPLFIHILGNGEEISVTNNLQPKSMLLDDSNKVGLENITSRYAIVTDQKVICEKTNDTFQVTIPLLKEKK